MGLADRTYMSGGPEGSSPPVTHLVLGGLVGVFILQLIAEASSGAFLEWMPLSSTAPQFWQWLTYALRHDGFWHLLGNGLLLWWVGPLVEGMYGRAALVRSLLLGTLVGGLAWYLTALGSPGGLLIGASAAVMTVLVVGLDGREDESVTLLLFFFLPVTLRVRWLVAFIWAFAAVGWVFSELPSQYNWANWQPAWESPIAHSAHLGGLITGWLLAWNTRRLERNPEPQLRVIVAEKRQPVVALARVRKGSTEAPSASLTPRAELDALLDKISAQGFGALSTYERQRLDELSQRLR